MFPRLTRRLRAWLSWLAWPLQRARANRPGGERGPQAGEWDEGPAKPQADSQGLLELPELSELPELTAPAEPLGPLSERTARAFLERAGFRIIAANYRCPLGELDLVAQGEGKLVFVEVKARGLVASANQGTSPSPNKASPPSPLPRHPRPEDTVTRSKQKKIGRAAKHFCRARNLRDAIVRFDVIAIDWPAGGEPVVRHHKAAFRPDV
jgi:putative endonuclease